MDILSVTIETPAGSSQKFNFDPLNGRMVLKKVLPAGMVFPFDFGFIPGTMGEDGDPLDVIVISEFSTFPGCSLECRIVGAFVIHQSESSKSTKSIRNDRIIAIPVESAIYSKVTTIKDLHQQVIADLEAFFVNYIELEGKSLKVEKRISAKRAVRLVEKSKNISFKDLLFEIFVPLTTQEGKSFPDRYYDDLKNLLLNEFGGVTVYHRSPATGAWDGNKTGIDQDQLIVFEVMSLSAEKKFWDTLKHELEMQFHQDEILIRSSRINRLI
ncbi:inorganic diphosphatase [Sphingobacterium paucimobilis]|uniref:inorganic diphosphatase n=1 Tax=Sphingobacterium paucimobilis HER1398 TaxID=1346330 RepID=U2HC11_9SPHI|nr:inorganic diphosphatase [Sphingobacterium paucimobilis]ERJ59286.1 hypothetical protein M472_10920 [Sphingobacterium paucimobilis HER1398]